jgi:hypothetical protein
MVERITSEMSSTPIGGRRFTEGWDTADLQDAKALLVALA